jgi:hypothetical protein
MTSDKHDKLISLEEKAIICLIHKYSKRAAGMFWTSIGGTSMKDVHDLVAGWNVHLHSKVQELEVLLTQKVNEYANEPDRAGVVNLWCPSNASWNKHHEVTGKKSGTWIAYAAKAQAMAAIARSKGYQATISKVSVMGFLECATKHGLTPTTRADRRKVITILCKELRGRHKSFMLKADLQEAEHPQTSDGNPDESHHEG